MKKILLIAILFSFIQTFAQKTYKVEKIVYQEKYDSFWSYVSIKDIDATISYNVDTLFVNFPQKEFYIADISSNIRFKHDDKTNLEFRYISLCASTKTEMCTLEFTWVEDRLEKITVIKLKNKIEYLIKKT